MLAIAASPSMLIANGGSREIGGIVDIDEEEGLVVRLKKHHLIGLR